MPYHVWADRVSPLVIGVGDPARAELFASILDGALVINTNRYLIYTGRFGKREVTVAAHGIGGPSAAILLEELKKLGMEVFVRIGTAGSLGDLSIGDVVVASAAAAPAGGLYGAYFGGFHPPLAADPWITARLASALGAKVGYVVSSDAFYGEDEGFVEFWKKRKALAVEMECAAVMALGWLREFRTGCVLVISNVVGRHERVDLRERFIEVFKKVVEAL